MLKWGKCESPGPGEDGAAQTVCDELFAAPLPHPAGRENCEWSCAQEKGGSGGKVFKDWIFFLIILLWFD